MKSTDIYIDNGSTGIAEDFEQGIILSEEMYSPAILDKYGEAIGQIFFLRKDGIEVVSKESVPYQKAEPIGFKYADFSIYLKGCYNRTYKQYDEYLLLQALINYDRRMQFELCMALTENWRPIPYYGEGDDDAKLQTRPKRFQIQRTTDGLILNLTRVSDKPKHYHISGVYPQTRERHTPTYRDADGSHKQAPTMNTLAKLGAAKIARGIERRVLADVTQYYNECVAFVNKDNNQEDYISKSLAMMHGALTENDGIEFDSTIGGKEDPKFTVGRHDSNLQVTTEMTKHRMQESGGIKIELNNVQLEDAMEIMNFVKSLRKQAHIAGE